jgi:hypothetical protein
MRPEPEEGSLQGNDPKTAISLQAGDMQLRIIRKQNTGYMKIRGISTLECPFSGLGGVARGFCELAACGVRAEGEIRPRSSHP